MNSKGGLAWMVALTVVIFFVMAASFRRWRSDLCTRPQDLHITDDAISQSSRSSAYTQDNISVSRNRDINTEQFNNKGFDPQERTEEQNI